MLSTNKPLPAIDKITALRQYLHQHPELSGLEFKTAETIAAYLQQFRPDQVLTGIGGTGVAAVFKGSHSGGSTLLFRAELDALPIHEEQPLAYTSQVSGISHKCGHDGHMAILVALAAKLAQEKPQSGQVVLLFQPAEETGAGAWAVLQDERFLELQPDYVFALHNMPGLPLHQVILKEATFAAASTGMVIELKGKHSHAAEPENGLNPGLAMSKIIQQLHELAAAGEQFQDLTLLTVIHARLGEIAFGTNPGFATVMATLRAFQQQDLDLLKQKAVQLATEAAQEAGLKIKIRFVEEFPATVNHPEAAALVKAAAQELRLELLEPTQPVKWSEDFGHFTRQYKGALFGLGSGLQQPQLHHIDYDFPDELIPTGAQLFYSITRQLLK